MQKHEFRNKDVTTINSIPTECLNIILRKLVKSTILEQHENYKLYSYIKDFNKYYPGVHHFEQYMIKTICDMLKLRVVCRKWNSLYDKLLFSKSYKHLKIKTLPFRSYDHPMHYLKLTYGYIADKQKRKKLSHLCY
jgi:hypothetical protein